MSRPTIALLDLASEPGETGRNLHAPGNPATRALDDWRRAADGA